MKTTIFKMWLVAALVIFAAACAKKNQGSTNGLGNYGYPGGGYPGSGYPGTGGSIPPGGIVASAAGLVRIDGGNLNVDFELFFRAGPSGTTGGMGPVTVDGQVRMNQSDYLCQIQIPPGGAVMPVVPASSQVTISGTETFRYVDGRIAVQGPYGIFNIGFYQVRLVGGTVQGRISGSQFPFYLVGSAQPGMCQSPSMQTDWSFDPL